MPQKNEERLQKYLAECGVASRRKSEELIAAGKVKVNGHVAKSATRSTRAEIW